MHWYFLAWASRTLWLETALMAFRFTFSFFLRAALVEFNWRPRWRWKLMGVYFQNRNR